MSDNNKNKAIDNDSLKKFKSSCLNFIKMFSEEKSDSIKISYLSGLIKLVQRLNIPPETIVETIFKNILFQKTDILKSPNLLFTFISFCRQTHDPTFQNNFYELLQLFGNDYKENNIYFKDYLIMQALEIFFDSTKNEGAKDDYEERKHFFNYIIETDIKEFKEQLFKLIIKNDIKLMDNEIKINFVLNFFEKIIIKNKYNIGVILLKIIKEEIKKNIPNEIIENLINCQNKNGFNSLIKKPKSINKFLIFNKLILENKNKEFTDKEKNEKILDIYLSNLLNILCIRKEFNIKIIKYIYNYYIINRYSILDKIFPGVIYHLSNYAYTYNQISFLFNEICKSDKLNPLYKWIIFKNPFSSNKMALIQTGFKPNLNNINIISGINEQNKKDITLNGVIDKTLFEVNEEQSNINILIHLSLYDYIINSSFYFSENNYYIDFYTLNRILELISSLSIEILNKNFYNDFIQFLLDYFSVLFEFCLSLNDNNNKDIIFKTYKSFLYLFKKMPNQKEDQLSIIFPSLIILLNNKNAKIEFIEPIADYMIDTFGRISRQCDLIFKTIKSLLFNKDLKNIENKFLLSDKLITLVIESNEHKFFESLFNLCRDLLKTKDNLNIKLNNYIINKYSKFYSGALSDLLQNYIIEKFDEFFVQKNISVDNLSDDDYYIINTIDNIYLQDKPVNLKDIVDKFYGDNYKKIIGIFDNIFEYMDKDENIKNVFKLNNNENKNNLIEEYCDMRNNVEEVLKYYLYIKKDCNINNDNKNYFNENKKLICIYGNTYYLVHLLTQYLSEKILNEKSLENEEEKKVENDKLMFIFDYIYEKILLNKNIKNIIFKSFFLNAILSNNEVLDYYLVKHTNNLVNLQIKEKELDFSKLYELSSSINSKKSFGLIKLIKNNPYNIILIKELILELFDYESDNIINPQNIDLYKNASNKHLIIKSIYSNQLFDKINDINTNNVNNNQAMNSTNKDIQMRINTCFSKFFFKEITDLTNKKSIELNQIFFIFCLDNEIFNKYYSSFSDFYDFDYISLEFYSLVRNKNCILDFKEKFLEFLKNFNFIENINVFSLRILSQEKTFEKLISKCDNHSDKSISILYDIIILLLNNLLKYNSFQNYTEKTIINILNNICLYINELISLSKNNNKISEILFKELYYLGKIINLILYEHLSSDSNTSKNKKFNINPKLQKVLSSFLSQEIIPKYIKSFFSSLNYAFQSEMNYSLQNIYDSFYFIIDFLEDINIKNEILNKIDKEKEIIGFINEYSFFKTNEVTNNGMNKLLINYSKYLNNGNLLYKNFSEYLFLFVIRNSKYSTEKIMNELILIFMDENNDNGFKDLYDKKKFAYLCYYYLIYKRNGNPILNDKNYLEKIKINFGDFDLVTNIGERFKVDL